MKDVLREALRTVLDPKSVAIVGASENPNKRSGCARTRYRRSRPFAGRLRHVSRRPVCGNRRMRHRLTVPKSQPCGPLPAPELRTPSPGPAPRPPDHGIQCKLLAMGNWQ